MSGFLGSSGSVGLGTSFGGSTNTFDPATLSLTGWWRSNFTSPPWVPTASAGSSGSRLNLVTHTGTVTAGTAQNGKIPAHFATADMLNDDDVTTFFTTNAGTLIALVKPTAASAPSGNFYDDPAIYHDSNADLCLTYTTSGFGAIAYSGSYKTKYVACATGAYHLIMMRWNGSTLGLTLDSAAESTTPCSTLTIFSGTTVLGQGYGGGFLVADMLELIMANTAFTNATYANIKSYVNTRYGLSL